MKGTYLSPEELSPGQYYSAVQPTGSCFDDAIELISAWLKEGKINAHRLDCKLGHGIAYSPGAVRVPFSHAWVELEGLTYQSGIYQGQKIVWATDSFSVYESLSIKDFKLYSIRQIWEENKKHVTHGPWEKRYIDLCSNNRGK